MNRRTPIVAAAVLAVGSLSFSPSFLSLVYGDDAPSQPKSQNQPAANPAPTDAAVPPAASDARDAHNEAHGLRILFTRAVDSAVSPTGKEEFLSLFVPDAAPDQPVLNDNGQIHPSGVAPGGLRTARDLNADAHGAAADRVGGNNGNDAAGNVSRDPIGDAQSHRVVVDQFNAAWKEKYQQDFRISDRMVVFADITADDILGNAAQPAGARLQGQNLPANGGPQPSTTPPSNNNLGNGNGIGAQVGGTNGVGPDSGKNLNTNPPGNAASGANPNAGIGANPGSAPNPAPANAPDASTGVINENVNVRVPAVPNAPAVNLRLQREGPAQFRFISEGKLDRPRLMAAVDRHLQAVVADKAEWPASRTQAERLVSQHILMAIADYDSKSTNENAQPAGANLTGQNALPSNGATNGNSPNSGTGAPSPEQIKGTNSQ